MSSSFDLLLITDLSLKLTLNSIFNFIDLHMNLFAPVFILKGLLKVDLNTFLLT